MLRKACLGIMSPVGRRGGQAPGQPHPATNSPLLTQIYQMLKGTGSSWILVGAPLRSSTRGSPGPPSGGRLGRETKAQLVTVHDQWLCSRVSPLFTKRGQQGGGRGGSTCAQRTETPSTLAGVMLAGT